MTIDPPLPDDFVKELAEALGPELSVLVRSKRRGIVLPIKTNTVQCAYCKRDCWFSKETQKILPKGAKLTFFCERKKCHRKHHKSHNIAQRGMVWVEPDTQGQREEARIIEGWKGRQ